MIFGFERSLAASPPGHKRLFALLASEHDGGGKKRTVKRRPIVIGELDQSRFDDQSTKLDQVACPLSSLHDPFPPIVTRSFEQEAIARRDRPPQIFLRASNCRPELW